MQSAASAPISEITPASASSGTGANFRVCRRDSYAGPTAQGRRVSGGAWRRQERKSDEARIRAILNALLLPAGVTVSDWIVRTGADSTDEFAIWVWAVLPDDTTDFHTRMKIRDVVFEQIRERSGVPGWVYVSFWSKTEMDAQS